MKKPNKAVDSTATRVTLRAWSLRSRHLPCQRSGVADRRRSQKYSRLTCVASVTRSDYELVRSSPRTN